MTIKQKLSIRYFKFLLNYYFTRAESQHVMPLKKLIKTANRFKARQLLLTFRRDCIRKTYIHVESTKKNPILIPNLV